MWLEVNNQGFEISKSGDLYTVAFSLYRGRRGRIPVCIHQASHTNVLELVILGEAKVGSLKLCKSKKDIWYALISVSMQVADTAPVKGWIGVDRGQNNIAVASLPKGFGTPYTSKSDHRNGVLGVRNGDWFRGYDGYRCNADWNASQNIGQWLGFSCPLDLQEAVAVMAMVDAEGERHDTALTSQASMRVDLSPA